MRIYGTQSAVVLYVSALIANVVLKLMTPSKGLPRHAATLLTTVYAVIVSPSCKEYSSVSPIKEDSNMSAGEIVILTARMVNSATSSAS